MTKYLPHEIERMEHEQDLESELEDGFEIVGKTAYVNSQAIGDTRSIENNSKRYRGHEMSFRGFHKRFDNGWTLSVQWGSWNYCEARDKPHITHSETAEIAAWRTDTKAWARWEDGETVQGWVNGDTVLALIDDMSEPGWKPPKGVTQH